MSLLSFGLRVTGSAFSLSHQQFSRESSSLFYTLGGNRSRERTQESQPLAGRVRHYSLRAGESRRFTPLKPTTDLDAFGGSHKIVNLLADVVRYLQGPEAFHNTKIRPPKGVLLSGPPGTGKSFLAEAIAGHAGVPLFLESGSAFHRPYVGEGEIHLRELFKAATSQAPCVVCIDEIDSIGSVRSDPSAAAGSGAHYVNSMVNQMLTVLAQDMPGVIVLGTTNHKEHLDPALIRPGRFDRHIAISLPDQREREEILRIHTKDLQLAPNVSLRDLAAISAGFSGAKLCSWANEAALAGQRNGSQGLTHQDFDEARTILNVGILGSANSDLETRKMTAAHEAGHAIVGHVLEQRLYKVTIRESGDVGGYVEWISDEVGSLHTQQQVLDQVCIALAGRAAEILSGCPCVGSVSDLEQAKELATMMVKQEGMGSRLLGGPNDLEGILSTEMKRAQNILTRHQQQWACLRDVLVEREELFEAEFTALLSGDKLPPATRVDESKEINPRHLLPPKTQAKPVEKREEKPLPNLPFSKKQLAHVLCLPEIAIARAIRKRQGRIDISINPIGTTRDEMHMIEMQLNMLGIFCTFNPKKDTLRIHKLGVETFCELICDGEPLDLIEDGI